MYIKVKWSSILLLMLCAIRIAKADTTIQVHLIHNASVCVGEKVTLTCPDSILDKNVLTYQWVRMKGADSTVIGTKRSVTVSPQTNTTYHLNILYVDMARNLIRQGDFEEIDDSRCQGDGKGPYPGKEVLPFHTKYAWISDRCDDRALWSEGVFKIARNPRQYHTNFFSMNDHTKGDGTGQMLLVNGHPGRDVIVWQQKICGIHIGTEYAFSAWGRKVADGVTPRFQFSISDRENVFNVVGGLTETYPVTFDWTLLFRTWKAHFREAYITLINQERGSGGNDFVVDDIVFAPTRKAHGEITLKVIPRFEMGAMAVSEACVGTSLTVDPVVVGETATYQWYKNGSPIPGAVNKEYKIPVVRPGDAGIYICEAEGVCGKGKGRFTLTVHDSLVVAPLKDLSVCKEKEAVFQVNVQSGRGHIQKYVWSGPPTHRNWTGKNTATYRKTRIENRDLGQYTCDIISKCGNAFLSARLDTFPDLTVHIPSEIVCCAGDFITLTGKTNRPAQAQWRWGFESGNPGQVPGYVLGFRPDGKDFTYLFEVNDTLCRETLRAKTLVILRDTLVSLTLEKERNVCAGDKVQVTPVVKGGSGLTWTWNGPGGYVSHQRILLISDFQESKNGYYRLTVTDECGHSLTDSIHVVTIEEFGSLEISGNQQVCLGDAARIEVTGGVPKLKYEWTTPSGNTLMGSTVVRDRILAQDTGWYTCRIESVCGREKELRAHISLYPPIEATGPLTPYDVCEGEEMTFTVRVHPEEHYIWKYKGIQVGLADQPYVIPHVQVSQGGKYECVITSPCGETRTLNYTLQVHEQTVIVGKCEDLYVTPGTVVKLFVNARGADLHYGWTKTGSGNIGFDYNTLDLGQVKVENAGEYVCNVMGTCGTASTKIQLHVGDYNEVTGDQTVNLCAGSTYSYTAAARPSGCTAEAKLLYNWKSPDGRTINETKALTLNDVTPEQAGVYTCTISGTCGTVTLHLTVVVFQLPELTLTADKDTLCEGESVHFTTAVNDMGGHTFEWRHEGRILGISTGQHTINDIALAEGGLYTCKVSSLCGSASEEVSLLVKKGLKIIKRPDNLFPCKGMPAELKVEATGDRLTYAWAGPAAGEWTGSREAVYYNPAVSHDASGQYRCVVNSSCGDDTLYVKVDIESDLELIGRTPNLAACIGDEVKLWAHVNLSPARYTWTFPDGTTSSLEEISLHPVTPAHRGRYKVYIESPAGCSSLLDSIGIGVYDEPGTLTASPADTAVCEGGTARFVAVMEGVDVTYSWMGPAGFKSDSAVIRVENVLPGRTGSYQVIARDICKHERMADVNLRLREDFKNIRISADTAVCLHSDILFRMEGGVPGMHYSWLFNGLELGTDAEFQLNDVDYTDAGIYICRTSTVCGSREDTVELKVLRPLEFEMVTAQEKNVCAGETVVFGVKAEGFGLIYHWQKEGVDVGTMDSLLTLRETERWDAGPYICHISSVCGDEQVRFDLHVKEETRIIRHSPDKHVSILDSVRLYVVTEGVNNRYEWKQNDLVLATDSVLTIDNVGIEEKEISYLVRVTGDCGLDSAEIRLRVGNYINLPLVDGLADTICEGSNYTYLADLIPQGCDGGERVRYEWFKKDQVTGDSLRLWDQDSTSSLFRLQDVVPADTGFYKCTITYWGCLGDGFDESKSRDTSFHLQLDMIQVPEILAVLPRDTAVVEGFDHEIRMSVSGDALTYVWEKDGLPLTGTWQERIAFSPVLLEDAGIYRLTLSNECSHTSATSRLKVNPKTVILNPLHQTVAVCRYSDTTLRVEAIGTDLIYRWYRDKRLVASSRKNEYRVTDVQENVDYCCVADGRGGKDTCYFYIRVEELPEVTLNGKEDICMSPVSYLQEYRAESPVTADLLWNWNCNGGSIRSVTGRPEVEVMWSGTGAASIEVTAESRLNGCRKTVSKDIRYVALPEVWLDLPEKVGYCIDSLVLNQAWPLGGKFVSAGDTVTALRFYVKDQDYQVNYYYRDPRTLCVGEAQHQLGVDVKPDIRLEKRDDTTGICQSLTLVVASHTPGTVSWKGSGLNLDTTDVWKPVFRPVPEDADYVHYEATLTDSYDCKASDYARIRVVYAPAVQTMKDTVVENCNGEVVDFLLKAEYVTSYFDRMEWLPAERTEIQPDYTARVQDLLAGENKFVAEVYDVFGCSGRDSLTVILATGPDLADREVCYGDTLYVDNQSYSEFRWSDGYDREQRVLTYVGSDTLWVKDRYGCEAKAAYTIRPLPHTDLVDTFLMRGHRWEFHLDLDPEYAPYDILWQDGTAVPVYVVEGEGEYWVKVTDNMGCTTQDTALITLIRGIHAPNAFLPESAGENSRFYLKEMNFIEQFEMYIYNRWGELIYKTREIGFNGGWDGTFKGKKCDAGTYVWIAFNNGKRLARGTVTLIK